MILQVKISDLPSADPLTGDELVPIVQGGVTKRALYSGGKGEPGEPGEPGEDGSKTFLAFDAQGNASAPRPNVPTTATVMWFNVPSEPTNKGVFDMWEEPA